MRVCGGLEGGGLQAEMGDGLVGGVGYIGWQEEEQQRKSHSNVVEGRSMWVVGGEFLHKARVDSMVRKWDLERWLWDKVVVTGEKTPQ